MNKQGKYKSLRFNKNSSDWWVGAYRRTKWLPFKKGHCSLALPKWHCPSPLLSRSIWELNRDYFKMKIFKSQIWKAPILLDIPLRSCCCSLSQSTSQAPTTPWSLQCETLWVTADSIDPLQETQSWLSEANRGSDSWLIPLLDAPQLSNLLPQKYRTIPRSTKETYQPMPSPLTPHREGVKEALFIPLDTWLFLHFFPL